MKNIFGKERFTYVSRLCALYLMLVLLIAIPPTQSRYTSQASGDSTGQVAKFDVEFAIEDLADDDVSTVDQVLYLCDLYPGCTKTFSVEIQNRSDVTVAYDVAFDLQFGALPLTVTYSDDNTSQTLAAGGAQMGMVTVVWDEQYSNPAFADEIDLLVITLHYEQVD